MPDNTGRIRFPRLRGKRRDRWTQNSSIQFPQFNPLFERDVRPSIFLVAIARYVLTKRRNSGSELTFAFMPMQVVLLPMSQVLGWLGLAGSFPSMSPSSSGHRQSIFLAPNDPTRARFPKPGMHFRCPTKNETDWVDYTATGTLFGTPRGDSVGRPRSARTDFRARVDRTRDLLPGFVRIRRRYHSGSGSVPTFAWRNRASGLGRFRRACFRGRRRQTGESGARGCVWALMTACGATGVN